MSGGHSRKIVVVDDSADDRLLLRRLLLTQGRAYELIEAETGKDGLALASSPGVDCVLLDFYLPDMDGHQFLEDMAAGNGPAIPVPVLMLTGQDDDATAFEALERGAQDFLVKDALTGRGLVRAIENSIAKHRVQRALFESQAAVELRNRKLEMLQEVLEQKLAELASANQTKDQFLAVMSHEMRTPLNAIIGYADLLEMELDGPLAAGQREQVERIRVGGRHLLELINDLLDLARADARKLEMDLRPVDLEAVLEEVAALLEREAESKGLQLTIEPCEEPMIVHADLQRLRQILVNLVGNAIKFTEEGSVVVRCSETDDPGRISVEVSDTGIGIDPGVIPLVFNEFYQAKGDLTRSHGGTGLGLAIAQRMAKLMGGDIRVESEVGEGSTFFVNLRSADPGSLLRADDVASQDARKEVQRQRKPEEAKDRVVAFSDDSESLAELERQVRGNVNLIWTTDAEEVAEIAVASGAVLVVLDISSSEGGAWRAAYALQEVQEHPRAAILLLPSLQGVASEGALSGRDPGWLSMVAKPFTSNQLTHAVNLAAGGLIESAPAADRSDYSVLIVDDDPDSRRVAAKFLQEHHVQIREAEDGESALLEMRSSPPAVVVLDLMMPVLDGFGVLAAMRADPTLARIPVVVLTAKDLTEAERQFLARTAMRVLQKGEHRLADVAALVLRAAARAPRLDTEEG